MTPGNGTSDVGLATCGKIALLADSGNEINRLLDGVLAGENWRVRRVPDNLAALIMATANHVDLIVTTWKDPKPENLEVLHKMRKVRPNAPLVILADRFTPGDVLEAMREGAFGYFSPPIEHEQLVEMVREAIASPRWHDGIEVLSGTPSQMSVTARCDIQTAHRLVQFLRGIKEPNIPEADREAVVTAFREILLNAMEYGGHFDPRQHVEISFSYTRSTVSCRIKDSGEGFSFQEIRHAAVSSPAGDLCSHAVVREEKGLRPGGFGVLIAKRLVDKLIYNKKGNDVLLVKYIKPTASHTV